VTYHYRGASLDSISPRHLWCIQGVDTLVDAAGVLEWCDGRADAEALIQQMLQDPGRFSGLVAQPWQ
jgi:hypothetical protein